MQQLFIRHPYVGGHLIKQGVGVIVPPNNIDCQFQEMSHYDVRTLSSNSVATNIYMHNMKTYI